MPAPRAHTETEAATALVAVAPLAARWIDRLLAMHDPPLTTPQYLALRAISAEQVTVNELARRAGVSGPAASQLLNTLAEAGLLDRRTAEGDRRRQELSLSADGRAALASAKHSWPGGWVADRGPATARDRRARTGVAARRGGAVRRRPTTQTTAAPAATPTGRATAAPPAVN